MDFCISYIFLTITEDQESVGLYNSPSLHFRNIVANLSKCWIICQSNRKWNRIRCCIAIIIPGVSSFLFSSRCFTSSIQLSADSWVCQHLKNVFIFSYLLSVHIFTYFVATEALFYGWMLGYVNLAHRTKMKWKWSKVI